MKGSEVKGEFSHTCTLFQCFFFWLQTFTLFTSYQIWALTDCVHSPSFILFRLLFVSKCVVRCLVLFLKKSEGGGTRRVHSLLHLSPLHPLPPSSFFIFPSFNLLHPSPPSRFSFVLRPSPSLIFLHPSPSFILHSSFFLIFLALQP